MKNKTLTIVGHFLKRCRFYLAIVVIVAALLTSLLRAFTPFIVQYQPDIERYLSKLLDQKVVIGRMETGWYWFFPVIKLTDLSVLNDQKSLINVHQFIVGFNLFSSLWHWQIEPGVLYVDKVHLIIHQRNDHWRVEGLDNLGSHGTPFTFSNDMPAVAWILAQQKLILKHLSVDLYLKDGTCIPIKQLNLVIAQHFGRYRLKSDLDIGLKKPTVLRVLADLAIDSKDVYKSSGDIYVDAHDVQPVFWQRFLPLFRFQVLSGLLNGRIWLTLTDGSLTSVQSNMAAEHFNFLDRQEKKPIYIDSVKGNWAWQKNVSGWRLSADRLALTLNGKPWPSNKLQIDDDEVGQVWKIYVKHVLLDSLLALNVNWPKAMIPLIQAKPQGDLQETQIHMTKDQVTYAVTRFSGLAWQGIANIPSVLNLSGVLYWEPIQGRLDLDGQKTTIKLKGKSPVLFQDLNVSLDWKKSSHGWQINLDRLILRHPDLLASFTGSTCVEDTMLPNQPVSEDNVSVIPPWHQEDIRISQLVPIPNHSGDVEPQINLKGALSATHAEFWMQYLPEQYLKPQLNRWLKHDIKRIDRLVAEVNVDGNIHDFPFDKALDPNQLGIFEINAHVSGLDLVFAPHWPLTRDIEADLHFDKRLLTADIVYAKLQDILVDELNLSVNNLGLSRETLFVHGKVQTTGPKAVTYVNASPLVKKLPLLKLLAIQGMLDLDLKLEVPLYPENDEILTQGKLTFDDNALLINHHLSPVKLDKVAGILAFSQEGVLDSRLKASLMDSPVTIQIKPQHKPHDATLVDIKGVFPIEQLRQIIPVSLMSTLKGTLPLEAILSITHDPGDLEHVHMSSFLKGLDIQLPAPFGKKTDATIPISVDCSFNQDNSFRLRVNYADFLVKAVYSKDGTWLFELNEANIAGKIHYQPALKKLTGELTKLYFPEENRMLDNKFMRASAFKISDLPNVELQIKDFHYGALNLGSLDCKATNKKSTWLVDDCSMKSSFYLIQAQGAWTQTDSVNKTNIDLNMKISDLGKTLSQWGLTPAVDARRGEIQLSGAWPGGFQDFSLADIVGEVLIVFKNGEITHLDEATEEKLGLGKLLSILSLQTLPRRLKLDFSDLTNKGYAFDVFRGRFAIKHGIMQTSNGVIDGPTASASIKGNLDIVQQRYDLTIKIAPHLTSSLPVVATIAGGPVIGAATWVASKIINQGMQKFSAYAYQIMGPWNKPIIKQIDVFKDLDKKILGVDLI